MKPYPCAPSILAILITVSSSLGREIELEKPSPKLRRFANDVIFEVEAGDREKFSKRLPAAIAVEFHGKPEPRPIAEKHLKELCEITGVTNMDGPGAAKIGIYFGTQEELAGIAKGMERKITLERGYTYWKWWDEGDTINRAVVFIATDKLSGAALEDRLLEQLLSVFGLPARSKEFDESCLSAEDQVLTSLQPVDKALLGFYYRAVPPGTTPGEFDDIFREKWSEKR